MCLVQTVFVWLLNLLFIRHRPSFPRKATLYPRLQYSHVRVSVCPKKGPKITSSSSKPPVSGGHSKYRFLPEKGPRIHLKFIETSGFRRTIKISFFARKRAQKHLKFIKTYGFRRTLKISFFAQKRAPNSPQVHRNLRFQADIQNIVFRPKKSPENTSSSSKPPVSGGHSKYRFSPEKGLRNQFKFIKTTGFQADTQNIVFSPKRGPEIRSSLSKPQVPTTLF